MQKYMIFITNIAQKVLHPKSIWNIKL